MDWFNLLINAKTSFNKNARAVKSHKLTTAFKKFVRENNGMYGDVDMLKPLGKTFNPFTKRIVNRSAIYTKANTIRSKYKHYIVETQTATINEITLSNKNIVIDRKILSDIAITDNETFNKIVKTATS